jgi:DNA-binding FrmR family transcriptional regulator
MEKDTQKKLLDRLSRAEGQIRALRKILQDEKKQDCKKFISQIKAASSALRSVSEQYVITHIHHCHSLSKEERESKITEAIKILADN